MPARRVGFVLNGLRNVRIVQTVLVRFQNAKRRKKKRHEKKTANQETVDPVICHFFNLTALKNFLKKEQLNLKGNIRAH